MFAFQQLLLLTNLCITSVSHCPVLQCEGIVSSDNPDQNFTSYDFHPVEDLVGNEVINITQDQENGTLQEYVTINDEQAYPILDDDIALYIQNDEVHTVKHPGVNTGQNETNDDATTILQKESLCLIQNGVVLFDEKKYPLQVGITFELKINTENKILQYQYYELQDHSVLEDEFDYGNEIEDENEEELEKEIEIEIEERRKSAKERMKNMEEKEIEEELEAYIKGLESLYEAKKKMLLFLNNNNITNDNYYKHVYNGVIDTCTNQTTNKVVHKKLEKSIRYNFRQITLDLSVLNASETSKYHKYFAIMHIIAEKALQAKHNTNSDKVNNKGVHILDLIILNDAIKTYLNENLPNNDQNVTNYEFSDDQIVTKNELSDDVLRETFFGGLRSKNFIKHHHLSPFMFGVLVDYDNINFKRYACMENTIKDKLSRAIFMNYNMLSFTRMNTNDFIKEFLKKHHDDIHNQKNGPAFWINEMFEDANYYLVMHDLFDFSNLMSIFPPAKVCALNKLSRTSIIKFSDISKQDTYYNVQMYYILTVSVILLDQDNIKKYFENIKPVYKKEHEDGYSKEDEILKELTNITAKEDTVYLALRQMFGSRAGAFEFIKNNEFRQYFYYEVYPKIRDYLQPKRTYLQKSVFDLLDKIVKSKIYIPSTNNKRRTGLSHERDSKRRKPSVEYELYQINKRFKNISVNNAKDENKRVDNDHSKLFNITKLLEKSLKNERLPFLDREFYNILMLMIFDIGNAKTQ
ncbi:hypothetical protein BDAP_001988 [Binucleata daphniae]